MASIRWTLTDAVVGDNYIFNANPNSDQEQYTKNLQFEAVVVPGALPLLYEGQDTPTTVTLSGTLLSQTQWQTFVAWENRRHQVLLTDDRGYARYIYIYQLQGTRKPSALYKWRMDWTMTAYLIGPATFPSPPQS